MKYILFFSFLVFWPLSFVHSQSPLYHLTYIEKRSGLRKEIDARLQGNHVFIDHALGATPDDLKKNRPWFLIDFKPFEEETTIQMENLPPLTLKRKFTLENKETVFGATLENYRATYSLQAKEEVIPLNKEEASQNEILKPFGVESVDLQGEGRLVFNPQRQAVVLEEFILKGEVLRKNNKEALEIEYAKGSAPTL